MLGGPPHDVPSLVDLTDLIHFRFSLLQQARLQLISHHISLALSYLTHRNCHSQADTRTADPTNPSSLARTAHHNSQLVSRIPNSSTSTSTAVTSFGLNHVYVYHLPGTRLSCVFSATSGPIFGSILETLRRCRKGVNSVSAGERSRPEPSPRVPTKHGLQPWIQPGRPTSVSILLLLVLVLLFTSLAVLVLPATSWLDILTSTGLATKG